MIENLIQNMIAISLGTMIFFSFVVAPIIFKVLDSVNAGKFVRKISIVKIFGTFILTV